MQKLDCSEEKGHTKAQRHSKKHRLDTVKKTDKSGICRIVCIEGRNVFRIVIDKPIFMRLIDRLQEYLSYSNITAYSFEHSCDLSNGYLGKQIKGKGAVGSDILEKIKAHYPDLSLIWLVTGRGTMLLSPPKHKQEYYAPDLDEEQKVYYTSKDDVIEILNRQIAKLEATIIDKEKIIALMEDQSRQLGASAYKRTR